MSTSPVKTGREPIAPIYPFQAAGESILLYDGKSYVGDSSADCSVTLRLSPSIELTWETKPNGNIGDRQIGRGQVGIDTAFGRRTIELIRQAPDRGIANNFEFFEGETPPVLDRLVVHWLNLPHIAPNEGVTVVAEERPRLVLRRTDRIGGWLVTTDARQDIADVHDEIQRLDSIAITHVSEVRSADGESFTPDAVSRLLGSLQFGLSFGLGRWVAPALPVGFDRDGRRVWERWSSWFCDPGVRFGDGWLYCRDGSALSEAMNCVSAAFDDEWAAARIWRPLLAMAIQSNRVGRIEQRIMTLHAALELATWVGLRIDRQMSQSKWRRLNSAAGRLRHLLTACGIETVIAEAELPNLARFVENELLLDRAAGKVATVDGPEAVARVRIIVIHPEPPTRLDSANEHRQQLAEAAYMDAWQLSRYYLTLLILHRLKYEGKYQPHLSHAHGRRDRACSVEVARPCWLATAHDLAFWMFHPSRTLVTYASQSSPSVPTMSLGFRSSCPKECTVVPVPLASVGSTLTSVRATRFS
jgi:hypothetical protein